MIWAHDPNPNTPQTHIRAGHWYTNIFEIGSQVNETSFMFSRGGTQGNEGETTGEEWYIENVLEELDIGREWFFVRIQASFKKLNPKKK